MRAGSLAAAGAGAAALAGAGWIGVTRQRSVTTPGELDADPLLDCFLSQYEVREVHQTMVEAPADTTWAAVRALDLRRSPVVRAIFRGREILMGATPNGTPAPGSFLGEVEALGWRELAEGPRLVVMGAVTRPWEADVVFRGLPPEAFATFEEPGYAKIVWNLMVRPAGERRSVFSTETRVATTDARSRRRFRRYWTVVSPGIRLIRAESLRMVRQEAEVVARREGQARPRVRIPALA